MSTDFFFKKKKFTLERKKAALTGAPLFCEIEEVKKEMTTVATKQKCSKQVFGAENKERLAFLSHRR